MLDVLEFAKIKSVGIIEDKSSIVYYSKVLHNLILKHIKFCKSLLLMAIIMKELKKLVIAPDWLSNLPRIADLYEKAGGVSPATEKSHCVMSQLHTRIQGFARFVAWWTTDITLRI